MHELSFIQGIFEQLSALKQEHQFERFNLIELVCGPYNCLAEEQLQFWFDEMGKGGPWQGGKIVVKRLTQPSFCPGCQREWGEEVDRCPDCQEQIARLQAGAVYISRIEVD